METLSVSQLINYFLDAIIKRFFLIAVLGIIFSMFCKKYKKHTEIDDYSIAPVFGSLMLIVTISFIILFSGSIEDIRTAFINESPIIIALKQILSSIFVLITTIFVVYKYRKGLFDAWGLFTIKQLKHGLRWGFVGFLIFGVFRFILLKYYKELPFADNVTLLIIFITVILVPIVEEVYFRGFVYPCFRGKTGIFRGMVLTSFAFMIFHQGWSNYVWIDYLWLSMIHCFIYEKSKSLLAPIILHASQNFCSLMFGF